MRPEKNYQKLLRGNEPELDVKESSFDKTIRYVILVSIAVYIILMLRGCNEIGWTMEPKDAIKTIVGEASNQGYTGMVAVAEVIRHKGSLCGFYGLTAKHSAHEPAWVWKMAQMAWIDSKTTNLTHHADHFENIHAFGQPYWVKNCVKTFAYRDHVFYREI